MQEIEKVTIHTDGILLNQFLKLAGVIGTGGEIAALLEEGLIYRNGEKETAKRRQLKIGDVVEVRDVGCFEVAREDG